MFGSENKRNVNRQEWKPDQLLRTLYKIWRGIFAAFKVLLGAAVTVFLIVAICSFVFATILGDYLEDDILPQANLNLSDLALDMNSIIYYIDSNDEIQVQQKIDSSVNRDWANYEDIPEHMVNAAIAIEDHRFYRHQGVALLNERPGQTIVELFIFRGDLGIGKDPRIFTQLPQTSAKKGCAA